MTEEDTGFVTDYREDQSMFIAFLIVAVEYESTILAKQSMADGELSTTTITFGGKIYWPDYNISGIS